MINYKKGLLSLAAVLAIASGANAASDYIPLASEDNDYRWVMFGVDGFAGNSQTADFDNDGTTGTDTVGDDVATAVLPGEGTGTDYLAEIKALNIGGTDALAALTINMDVTTEVLKQTEPMRTMFLKLPTEENGAAGEANVMFTYKSTLEGNDLELQNNDSTVTYTATVSALNTYDNPAVPSIKTVGGDSNASLTLITDIYDYDFTNNPQDSASYLKNTHQDDETADTNAKTRIYSYNAQESAWKIYDSKNSEAANDFTALNKGMGYWGRMDLDADNLTSNDDNVSAGLVLGSQGIVDADYDDNNLTDGWNLMSFDSQKPDIINATTGMRLLHSATGDFVLFDSTGENNVTITLAAAGTPEVEARTINMAVESAKARGEFQDSFDLRAFGANGLAANHIVLISNKRFYVQNDTADVFTTGVSLDVTNDTTRQLWNETNGTLQDFAAATDFPHSDKVASVYGDYSIAFRPMVSTTSAANLDYLVQTDVGDAQAALADDLRSAAIIINGDTDNLVHLVDMTAVDSNASLVQTVLNMATELQDQPNIAGTANSASGFAISIDVDNNGTDDYIIATSDTPFDIADHTFTRVYDHTVGIGNHYLAGTQSSETAPGVLLENAGGTLAELSGDLNATADLDTVNDTGVYSYLDGSTKIVLVSASTNTNLFDLRDNATSDLLEDATSTLDTADGAVTDVLHIDTMAKRPVYAHSLTMSFDEQQFVDFNGSDLNITFNGAALSDANITIASAETATERETALDQIVADITREITVNGYDGHVYHDFNVSDATYPVTLTIESYTLNQAQIAYGSVGPNDDYDINSTNANSTQFGELITQTGDATTDLRYNAVSTKSYAQSGPLYTMKDAGYTIKSMITGNTNITAGTVAWDSIDLTRTAQEMFDSQDFNLFSIDGKAGYWVYLETNTDTNDLNITAAGSTLVPSVTHHFDSDTTTAVNHISTDLTVTVGGLTVPATGVASTERVWASVGGTTVELTGDPDTGEYTADIDTYAIAMSTGTIDVTVSVSNGEGWLLATQSVGTIDNEKPNLPTIDLTGGFSVDSNSTDVVGYYIFQTAIDEVVMHQSDPSTGSNYIGYVLDGAASIDFCSSSAISFNNSIDLLSVAVDGGGTFTTGNISDVAEATYFAIEKGSNHYSHLGLGAAADELAVPYSDTCEPGDEDTADTGVSLKSITTGVVAKLAIAPIDGASFDLDIPYTIYVGDGTNIAEIKFSAAYLGKPFYIQFDNVAYDGILPANVTGGANGTNVTDFDISENAADLTGVATVNLSSTGAISGQSF